MAEVHSQHRLAAILAISVVGYSRLIEANEAGAMAALKVWRRGVSDPLAVKHQGRVFRTAGNCLLAEFGSAINAVQCAMDLQHAMATANGDQPEPSASRSASASTSALLWSMVQIYMAPAFTSPPASEP